jgi:hypothetical protein
MKSLISYGLAGLFFFTVAPRSTLAQGRNNRCLMIALRRK